MAAKLGHSRLRPGGDEQHAAPLVTVSGGYALQPDPRVERFSQIRKDLRQLWLERAFAAAIRKLSTKGREALSTDGSLSATSLPAAGGTGPAAGGGPAAGI